METQVCTTIPQAWVAPDFCAYDIPVAVDQARGILAVGTSDFLTVEAGSNRVSYSFDSDGDGLADSHQIVAQAENINHGLAVQDGYLYASSDSHIYRWPIQNNSSFLEGVGSQEIVIDNINYDGWGGTETGHWTRTLIFDDMGRLYVSVGSVGNVDVSSFRARIRRFDFANVTSEDFPIDFTEGEVFADGLRNEVGLAFDRFGVLHGVENGADNLYREDLGGDIHQDNPAEEFNRFREEDAGKHWGYPFCWTEYKIPEPFGMGQGTVWAWPSFLDTCVVTDELCRGHYIPPIMSLQGHSAPLGITFYQWKEPRDRPESCPPSVAFPRGMDGFAFIAYHGSWNRDIPTGYKVVYVEMDEFGDPVGTDPVDLLKHNSTTDAQWDDGFRPVDVDFDECGRLLISSDGTRSKEYAGSKIVRMESTLPASSPAPSAAGTSAVTYTDEGYFEFVVRTSNKNGQAPDADVLNVKDNIDGASSSSTESRVSGAPFSWASSVVAVALAVLPLVFA